MSRDKLQWERQCSVPAVTGFQMSARIQIVFYSMYGHVYQMAEAVAAGAREAGARKVSLSQVLELVPTRYWKERC